LILESFSDKRVVIEPRGKIKSPSEKVILIMGLILRLNPKIEGPN